MKKTLLLAIVLTTGMSIAQQPNQGFDNFWRDFDQQFQRFDRTMNNLRQHQFQSQSRQYFDNTTNSYIVEIQITGLDKNDIKIEQKDNNLIVQGSKESKNESSHTASSFYNSFSLPDDADGNNINAKFANDILTISIAKLDQPKLQIRKITIK